MREPEKKQSFDSLKAETGVRFP